MGYAYGRRAPFTAENLIGMMADAFRRWRSRCEFARFAQDNPSEVERMALDLNIDKAGLLAVAAQDSGTPNLLRRLKSLGLDPDQIRKHEPAVARDLARCCALCSSKARCGRDLARLDSVNWRSYCPNESTLKALGPDFAVTPQGG